MPVTTENLVDLLEQLNGLTGVEYPDDAATGYCIGTARDPTNTSSLPSPS